MSRETKMMDFFQSRYYKVNKRLLFYLGQWPLQTSRERSFFRSTTIILVGSIVVPKLIRFGECLGNIDGMIQCLPVLGLHVISVVKFCNFIINAKKMKQLIYRIREDCLERAAHFEDTTLIRYAERGRLLTLTYGSYLFATLWTYLLMPAIPIIMDVVAPQNETRNRLYLYETQYFVNPDKYYFWILIHAYITMPFSVGIIIAFDTMFAVYVHHACGIFATLGFSGLKPSAVLFWQAFGLLPEKLVIILQNSWIKLFQNRERLTSLGGTVNKKMEIHENPNEQRDKVYENIVACIKMHKKAVEFATLIESSCSICFLFVIGTCILMITITGYMTVMNLDDPGESIRFGAFTLGEIFHLFYLCWQGQELMEHSEHIFQDAYNVEWYDISTSAKRLLILIMLQSSRPCKITAGKIYVLSLEHFTIALKTSMSYFTVMLSMK